MEFEPVVLRPPRHGRMQCKMFASASRCSRRDVRAIREFRKQPEVTIQ